MQATKEKVQAGQTRQFISFTVGEETYGLNLVGVREVIRTREVTVVPGAPSWMKGIINLRGNVIPIIDLRERFGLEPGRESTRTRVIVTEADGGLLGLVVDSASQVTRVNQEDFEVPPAALGKTTLGMISEIGKVGDDLVIMIDAERLLDDEEMQKVKRIVEGEPHAPFGA